VTKAVTVVSDSPSRTLEAGRLIGKLLVGSIVVELNGPLGAGKTQFAKGLAAGLGAPDEDPVVSPTFVLVRQYAGRIDFYHCDAYRLGSVEELMELGLEEVLEDGAVVAIEWADRFPGALSTRPIRIDIDYGEDDSTRIIRIQPATQRDLPLLPRRLKDAGFNIRESDDG